jgi:hypothetical protein
MERTRSAGLTLVEVLVAVALSAIIVTVVVSATVQVQKSIAILRFRADAVAPVDPAFATIEQDLKHTIACTQVPAPFSATTNSIAFDSPSVTSQPNDPPSPFVRKADTLTVLETTPEGWRAVVRYCLEGTGTSDPGTRWSESPTTWVAPVDGGVATSRLFRHVLAVAAPGGALESEPSFTTPTVVSVKGLGGGTLGTVETPEVLCENVVSFELSYIPATGTTYQPVTPATGTATNPFTFQGTLVIAGLSAGALGGPGSADALLLTQVPLGSAIELAVNADPGGTTSSWKQPTTTVYARRLSAVAPELNNTALTQVELTERPYVSAAIARKNHGFVSPYFNGGLNSTQPKGTIPIVTLSAPSVAARAFAPPRAVGVTLVVRYGLGRESALATFHTEIELPHP